METDDGSNRCKGIIAFSKTHNRITFFAVSKEYDYESTGEHFIKLALKQLDSARDITINILKGEFKPLINQRELFERYSFYV